MTREELIAAARAAPTELERLAEQTDANLSGIEKAVAAQLAEQPPMMPSLKLVGEDRDAYAEFCAAAAALEGHHRASGPVMERYKAALARLSERAAKVGG